MQIITVDDEVTVEFAFYHIHLSDVPKALDFVDALQTEAFLKSDQNAFKEVKSWKGTYDRG